MGWIAWEKKLYVQPLLGLFHNDGVICKLQEVYWGVFRCAVICVQGEEQWGENTALRSSSADRTGAGWEFSQPH